MLCFVGLFFMQKMQVNYYTCSDRIQKFIDTVKNQDVKLVGMSALLTTTMPSMKSTIEAMKEAGVRDKVKVIIGGAPVSQAYADEIGADGYSPDAASAVEKAKELLNIA